MGFLSQFIRHPQQLWVRSANFQIHLWLGIALSIYVALIGLSGSILVFGRELGRALDPDPWSAITRPTPTADLSDVIDSIRSSYPHTHVVSIMAPTEIDPVFTVTLLSRKATKVAFHPVTAKPLGEIPNRHSRLDWIYDLHENLFAGRAGRVANAICALLLLLLTLTGLINWWSGIKVWARALKIDFRRRWRRLNFDIHSAVGFWSCGALAFWAFSGIYFTWPANFVSVIGRISPLVNARAPAIAVERQENFVLPDFRAMLQKARTLDPGTTWKGIIFPSSRRSPFQILMSRSGGIGREDEDTLYFNPYNGQYISTWQYGVNKTFGDWFVWLQVPLHFGTHWGLAFKCFWALLGLSLPVLAVRGLLMYWNRFLSKRWKSLKGAA